jgi:hypothetical protein
MNRKEILFGTAALALALVACDKQQEPEYPQGTGGYGAQNGGYGAQYGSGAASAEAERGAGAADTASNQAVPLPAGAAVLSSPMLKGTAQKETAGMTEDGGAFGGTFQEGQILEHPFHIQPGRCYTVVGLVAIVVHQPPAPEWLAASDATTGPHAILGGGGNCFKNPFPVGAPAKVRLKASGGQGVAVAQIYAR